MNYVLLVLSFCLPERHEAAKFQKSQNQNITVLPKCPKSLWFCIFAIEFFKKKLPSEHLKILVFGSHQDE